MPSLKSIERFKQEFLNLGHEPEVLAEKGETPSLMPTPEEGIPDDLSELLGGFGEEARQEPGQTPDETAEEAPEGETPEGEAPSFDDLDLFGEQETEGESLEIPAEEAAPSSEVSEEPQAEDASALDDFDIEGIFPENAAEEAAPEPEFSAPEDFSQSFGTEDSLRDGVPEEEPESEEPVIEDSLAGDEFAEQPFGEDVFDETALAEGEISPPEDIFSFPEPDSGEPGAEESKLEESEFTVPETGEEEIPDFTPSEEVSPESSEDFSLPPDMDLGGDFSAPETGEGGEEAEISETGDEFALPEGFDTPEPGDSSESFGLPPEEPASSFPEGTEESAEMSLFDETESGAAESGPSKEPEGESFTIPDGFPFEEEPGSGGASKDDLGIPEDFGADDNFELDEFNLGKLGDGFGILEDVTRAAPETEEELNPAAAVSSEELVTEELSFSEDEFEKISKNLSLLPRNVKIVVEELIGEKGLSGDRLKTLLGLLIRGAGAAEVAAYAGKITGKRLKIPAQYEKRTGEEFEAEKDTFAYNFRKNILPLIRVFAIGAVILAMVGFLSYRFVYKPLKALSLYNSGYKAIGKDNFNEANELFDEASIVWLQKKQFYRYAEGFRDKKQFGLAEEKYEKLLGLFPADKKGTLDYARMEWSLLSKYEQAIRILKRYLDVTPFDYEALLMQGDVYLDWGDEDGARYEDARFSYANLIERNGVKTELLFRMLKYFIRTDNAPEVERLKEFFQEDTKLKVDPAAYAELGGYLIDKNDVEDVRDILFRAVAVSERMPELHYELARLYLKLKDSAEENKALDFAIAFFEESKPLSKKQLAKLIDALRRKAENRYAKKDYLVSEQSLTKAIDLYTDARDRNILKPAPVYGKLFSNLGDIYYYIEDDLALAYDQFSLAEENGYTSPPLNYKKGFILYDQADYADSLSEFTKAAGRYSGNLNLAYSTANAFYRRNDQGSAEGFYRDILRKLIQKRTLTENFRPEERDDHRIIMENLMKVYNNLGVTLNALWYKTGDNAKFSESLVCFTKALEIYDSLMRNTEGLERTDTRSIPMLNQMYVLYPPKDYILQLYDAIPKDMDIPAF